MKEITIMQTTAQLPTPVPQVLSNKPQARGGVEIGPITGLILAGILLLLGSAYIANATKAGETTQFFDMAERIGNAWNLGTMKCGVSNVIGTSPITTTASAPAHLQLLADGTGIAAAYTGCWQSADIQPLTKAGVRIDGSGNYTLNGKVLALSNIMINGRPRVGVTFQALPDATVLELYQRYGTAAGAAALAALAASNSTDTGVQYGTATGGFRDVTVIR